MGIDARPLTVAFAGECRGVDLSADLSDAAFAGIETLFARHPVLVFRDQALDAAALARFARRFGDIVPGTIPKYRHDEVPEISWLTNVEADGAVDGFGVRRASAWHYDGSFAKTPPICAMLHALEVPAEGGGTLFADMVRAAATLPEVLRHRVGDLETVNHYGLGPEGGDYRDDHAAYAPVVKPLVMVHPRTGRPRLEFCMIHTAGFVGLDEQEGRALLSELLAHATADDNVYYHRWRPGDLVLWDEHATLHRNAGDFAPEARRVMLRAMVAPTTCARRGLRGGPGSVRPKRAGPGDRRTDPAR